MVNKTKAEPMTELSKLEQEIISVISTQSLRTYLGQPKDGQFTSSEWSYR